MLQRGAWPPQDAATLQPMGVTMFEFLAGLTLEAVVTIVAEAALATVAAKAASDIYDYVFSDEDDE